MYTCIGILYTICYVEIRYIHVEEMYIIHRCLKQARAAFRETIVFTLTTVDRRVKCVPQRVANHIFILHRRLYD